MKLTIDGRSYEIDLQPDAVVVGGVPFKTTVLHDNGEVTVRVGGRPYRVKIVDDKTVVVDGRTFSVELSGRRAAARPAPKPSGAAGNASHQGSVTALMPGTVLSVAVQEGDQVAAGDLLLVLEAMKMQNEIRAPHCGAVRRVSVTAGQTVARGDVLVVIE